MRFAPCRAPGDRWRICPSTVAERSGGSKWTPRWMMQSGVNSPLSTRQPVDTLAAVDEPVSRLLIRVEQGSSVDASDVCSFFHRGFAPLRESPGGALAAVRTEMESSLRRVTSRSIEPLTFKIGTNRPASIFLQGERRAHGYFSEKSA